MDTPEDIDVEATSPPARRFRTWRIAVITLGTVCLATAGVWLLQPSSQDAAARRVLNPRTDGESSGTEVVTIGEPIEDISTATSEAPPAATDPAGIDATTSPTIPPVVGAPNGSYWAAYEQGLCDDGFRTSRCVASIDAYCAATPPPPWFLPDFTGLHAFDFPSPSQVEHAYAYEMCTYRVTPRLSASAEYVCNADLSLAGRVISNITPVGTPVHELAALGGVKVLVAIDCSTTTTCVLVTEPPRPTGDYLDYTPTSAYNCH